MHRQSTTLSVALILIGFSENAHAYLDPGTGSILLQAFLGAIAGALVLARRYWTTLKRFFGKGQANRPKAGESSEPPQ